MFNSRLAADVLELGDLRLWFQRERRWVWFGTGSRWRRRRSFWLLLLETEPAFERSLVSLQLVVAAADADVVADSGLHEGVESDGLGLVLAGLCDDVLRVETELLDEFLQGRLRLWWRRLSCRYGLLPGPQPRQEDGVVCVWTSLCCSDGLVSEAGQARLLLRHNGRHLPPLRARHDVVGRLCGVEDCAWPWSVPVALAIAVLFVCSADTEDRKSAREGEHEKRRRC